MFAPQHLAAPASVTAQVWLPPAAMAVVTDEDWMRPALRALSFLLPGKAEGFRVRDLESAKAWLAEASET